MTGELAPLLGIHPGDMAAFVGGGGKTRLLVALGRELAGAGLPLVMTTTTRMGVDEIPAWAATCHTPGEILLQLSAGMPVFVAGTIGVDKVSGIDRAFADEIRSLTPATLLVEADGAKRRSFKAPASHEPVIPSSTTVVIVVAGLDAIGGKIEDVCHRPDRVAALAGRDTGDRLRPEDMARVLASHDGGMKDIPEGTRVTIALTAGTRDRMAAIESITNAVPALVAVVPAGR